MSTLKNQSYLKCSCHNYTMNTLIFVAAFVIAASAAPPDLDFLVDVLQDSHGYYKFNYKTATATREEEHKPDGEITGTFTYVDENGVTQTVHYSGGVKGFLADGSTIPVEDKAPVGDTPEVAHARKEHLQVVKQIEAILPPSDDDGSYVEKPEEDLSEKEFLAAVSQALKSTSPLVFTLDTPEIAVAKDKLYDSYVTALGH